MPSSWCSCSRPEIQNPPNLTAERVLHGRLYIQKNSRNSYYLYRMLQSLLSFLRNEVLQMRDREEIKKLIATIQAKRKFKKEIPSSGLTNRILKNLDETKLLGKSDLTE